VFRRIERVFTGPVVIERVFTGPVRSVENKSTVYETEDLLALVDEAWVKYKEAHGLARKLNSLAELKAAEAVRQNNISRQYCDLARLTGTEPWHEIPAIELN
jgi:hypothetical protein